MTQYARPDSDVSIGSWTDQDESTSNLYTTIDETSYNDSDYIKSSDMMGATDTCIFGLGDVDDPSSAADHKVYFRSRADAGGGFSVPELLVQLLQGGTQIATNAYTGGGSFSTQNFTLSTAEANAISDYSDLRLRFVRNSSDGGFENVDVSWAYFECPDASVAAVSNPAFLLFVD